MRPTRDPKKRFIQTFVTQPLGQIELKEGRQRVTIHALSAPAAAVCDLKCVRLNRLD